MQDNVPVKVTSLPLGFGSNSTPYFEALFAPLNDRVVLRAYEAYNPFQSADILHVHWLEQLLNPRYVRRLPCAVPLLLRTFSHVAKRVAGKGAVVWTAHNLQPHEPAEGRLSREWNIALTEFLKTVDVAIAMDSAQLPSLRSTYPDIPADAWSIVPHPHYTDVYSDFAPEVDTKAALGIPTHSALFCALGTIRRYKAVPELIQMFKRVALPDDYLLIAGQCFDDGLLQEITAASGSDVRIRLRFGKMSAVELASYYKASAGAIFNFTEILNSGSVITALSLAVPVIVPRTDSFQKFQQIAKGTWITLCEGGLNDNELREFLSRQRTVKVQGQPDLSAFDPKNAAQQQLLAYGRALERARSRRAGQLKT